MDTKVVEELAPTGILRAGVNMANPLLVTGRNGQGGPAGVSPDMAAAIAARLGVGLELVPFPSPGAVADAVADDAWDIALIAADPKRAETLAFAPPYVEIEATYMVPAGSPVAAIEDVDREGVRIAVSGRSAYDLWLTRHIARAELVRADGLAAAFALFRDEGLEVLAGLRPALIGNAAEMPGARILDGRYMTVQQAIAVQPGKPAALEFVSDFVTEAVRSGLVADLISRHGVEGRLTVAS